MGDNPYRGWLDRFVDLLRDGAAIGTAAPGLAMPAAGLRTALIFAPHPDDEVIIGGLPLRLRRECGFRVVDMAVTLGSRVDRREARWREVGDACAALGFELVTPDRGGLDLAGAGSVALCAALLEQIRPDVVLLPHAGDWNQTHVAVHALAMAALRAAGLRCLVVETEYWAAMAAPNLMVESSAADVADLVAALSLHVGEVARNPYHLTLPAWMIDNVRRGAELVGGQGGAAPDFGFATLYRLRGFRDGGLHDVRGAMVGRDESLLPLFEAAGLWLDGPPSP